MAAVTSPPGRDVRIHRHAQDRPLRPAAPLPLRVLRPHPLPRHGQARQPRDPVEMVPARSPEDRADRRRSVRVRHMGVGFHPWRIQPGASAYLSRTPRGNGSDPGSVEQAASALRADPCGGARANRSRTGAARPKPEVAGGAGAKAVTVELIGSPHAELPGPQSWVALCLGRDRPDRAESVEPPDATSLFVRLAKRTAAW